VHTAMLGSTSLSLRNLCRRALQPWVALLASVSVCLRLACCRLTQIFTVNCSASGRIAADVSYNCNVYVLQEEPTHIDMNEPVALTFALRYLINFTKATSLSPSVVSPLRYDCNILIVVFPVCCRAILRSGVLVAAVPHCLLATAAGMQAASTRLSVEPAGAHLLPPQPPSPSQPPNHLTCQVIKLSKELPVVVEYKCADMGYVRYYLAPKASNLLCCSVRKGHGCVHGLALEAAHPECLLMPTLHGVAGAGMQLLPSLIVVQIEDEEEMGE